MIAGFDIGGTKCAVVLAEATDGKPKIVARSAFPTQGTPQNVLTKMADLLQSQLMSVGKTFSDVTCVGIACGGPLDAKRGLVCSPPNLFGWDNVPVVAIVSRLTGVKSVLQNDADACAVAEWKYGAGRGCDNMVFLTFGTGLGAGLILNGKLYTGVSNFAGEVGHIRLAADGPSGYGKNGSFEGFCSGGGIAKLAKMRIADAVERGVDVDLTLPENGEITAKDLFAAAENGSAFACKIFAEVGDYLGLGLSYIADMLNPDKIVIGGVYMRAHKYMDETMYARLKREALTQTACVEILPSELGEQIGDYAALSICEM